MIDVAVTPAELRSADVAVVIDVLRATSTVAEALAAGYRRVLCVDSIERAAGLRAGGRVLAGEQDCVMPPGFDQGNSPLEAMRRRGEELVLATTNGAPAIVAALAHAPVVVLGCLLNLDALLGALRDRGAETGRLDIQLVCSGTGGGGALEDMYAAGRICEQLEGERTDAALIAQAVTRVYATPHQALDASADARVLREAELGDDIAHCALESRLDVVPRAHASSAGVAVVTCGEQLEGEADIASDAVGAG